MSEIYTASGRRKTAVAHVTLEEGSGNIVINGEPFEEALPTLILQGTILEPLQLTKLRNKFDIKAHTRGGGSHGQADAIKLAISRALLHFDAELRPPLKAAGLLRRDPRARERKKPGQPGARKRVQFSKR